MTQNSSIKASTIIKRLKSLANPKNVAGMARFGIKPHKVLGIPMPYLRQTARRIGKNHTLAQELWASGIHEAQILASLVDEAHLVTERQMEQWPKDFDSWGVCDQVCMNLFDKTSFAYAKTLAWGQRKEEFIKRAGFALMAALACHDKQAPDKSFLRFLPAIKRAATDERNFVRKAVNWALRGIGKRNLTLNKAAIKAAQEIHKIDSKSARWIAADALRELSSDAVQERLKKI
jgi:3-methyladenine DNA glycosylase AlkD